MKKLFNLTIAACLVAAAVVLGSCSEDNDALGTVVTFTATMDEDESVEVLEAYADNVVIARYENLAEASADLYAAVVALNGDVENATKITTAADAWVAARQAWERTEAYLFGPVAMYKIDPGIDSWPLSLADIATQIGNSSLTFSDVRNSTGDYKGFHAIEFLLFEGGVAKSKLAQFNDSDNIYDESAFTSLTGEQIQFYLELLTTELYYNTSLLVAEWDSASNDIVVAFTTATGIALYTNNGGGYRDDFVDAGGEDSSYSDISDALSIILESATGIADEVGDVKIKTPYTSGDVLDVESWFSWNSVLDFTDNIIGIKEAYYGVLYTGLALEFDGSNAVTKTYKTAFTDEPADDSISAYVASGSVILDSAIKEAIEAALEAVSSLPYPYRNNLDQTSYISAAMDACVVLVEALEDAQSAVNDGYYIE